MKRKAVLLSVIGLVLLIITVTIFIISTPYPLKYFFYSGDRITGTFTMTVAGVEYDPVEEMLEYENQGTQRLHDDINGFTIRGGAYGSYKISFLLDNTILYQLTGDTFFETFTSKPILTYQYINTNWWHVTEMTLTAEMVIVNEEWVINTKTIYSEPLENGDISVTTVEKAFTYAEVMQGKGIVQFGV